jgi:hypothetical protein
MRISATPKSEVWAGPVRPEGVLKPGTGAVCGPDWYGPYTHPIR